MKLNEKRTIPLDAWKVKVETPRDERGRYIPVTTDRGRTPQHLISSRKQGAGTKPWKQGGRTPFEKAADRLIEEEHV